MKKFMKMLICTILVASAICCAVSAKENVKPGLNVFTGTTEAFDFEGDLSKVVFGGVETTDTNGKTVNAVVTREKDGNAENHAASLKGAGGYFYIDCDFPVIDKDRPVKIAYDHILGIGGSQLRTLINYPKTFGGSNVENATFAIYLYSAQTEEVWRSASVEKSAANEYKYSNGVVYYPGGEDIKAVSFINYSGKAQASYFDNLLYIPYYKISFDVNGGIGNVANEYFLQDAGTKYTIKTSGGDFYKNGYAFKGWSLKADASADDIITQITVEQGKDITLYAVWEEDETVPNKYLVELYDNDTLRASYVVKEGSVLQVPELEFTEDKFLLGWETADGNTLVGWRFYPNSNIKLYAKWVEKKVYPGINIFDNGDFEKDGIIDVRPSNGVAEIVSENGNKVLKYTRGSDWASVQHFVPWESGRKYKISYKVKTPIDVGSYYNVIYKDGDAVNHTSHHSAQKDTWITRNSTITFPKNSDSFTYTESTSDAISLFVNPLTGVDNIVYYDDLVFTPYYKVVYNATGGTGAPESEYFLEGTYTVNTQIKPERKGYTFLGWTLKNGSVNLVTEVSPTPGNDIELFAAWQYLNEVDSVSYEFDSDVPGIANGVITVKLNDETASYTSAEIYLANNDGILDNYTPFADMIFEDGKGTYTVSGNRAFPKEATRLSIKFIGEGLDDVFYWYTIPEEHRTVLADKPLYSFWAVSDAHLGGDDYHTDYWSTMTVNRNNAFEDIFASDADFVFITGDVVNYGTTPYLKVLDSYLADRLNNPSYNTKQIPVFLTNGNHEYYNTSNHSNGFDYEAIEKTFNGQLDYLEQTYGENIKITRGMEDELWYAVDYKGVKLIVLSAPQVSADRLVGSSFNFSDEQLNFLEEQLYDGEKSGKTTYVISHAPLTNTIPNEFKTDADGNYIYNEDGSRQIVYAGGITNTAKVNEILAKHPNVIFFSGHTHSDLSTDEVHMTVVNDMVTAPSHINDGCLVWLDAWQGLGDIENGVQTTRFKKFSTGVYLEVYSDKILVRSRKFLDESLYFGHGVYLIDVPNGDKEIPDVTVSGKLEDNETISAVVNCEIPSDDAPYKYEWYIGKELISTEKSFKIAIKGNFAGEYIKLRVTFEDGTYASALSSERFDGVKITYDINGGTGGAVPTSHTWIPGKYMTPDVGSQFPKMEGKFFIGWSRDKNAVKPEANILVEDDITLYAVYSDKPEFFFDANLSGFKSSELISEIKDGILNVKSLGGDIYYTWTNSSFSADTYKYMRIKYNYISGSGDGMFFGINGTGVTGTRRMALSAGTVKVQLDTDFIVKEYDMSALSEWTGDVTTLRYDVFANNGEADIDYVIFSDKKGVYKINITSESGNTGTVSEDSDVILTSIERNGNILTAVVTPKEGYEFTFVDELVSTTTINNYPISEAVINDDGTATLTIDFDNVVVTNAIVKIGSGKTDKYIANFGKKVGLSTIIAAAYNENGRIVGTGIIKKSNDVDGIITVNVAEELESKYVKVMAFDISGNLKVLAEEAVSHGNLIINGDAEGSETTAIYSENGKASIVEDDERGNVWEVVPSASTHYTYMAQKFTYIPGATYKLSAYVKLIGTSVSTDISTSINSNARYYDVNKKRDHILSQTICKPGEWVLVEYTFTIPADATISSTDEFCFYSNPVDIDGVRYGVTYRIDDIDLQIWSMP